MSVDPKTVVRRLNPTCTVCLQRAVEDAALGHYYEVSIEHVLARLMADDHADIAHVFAYFGVSPLRARGAIERALQAMRTGNPAKPVFAENLFSWFERAWTVASLERDAVAIRSGDLLLEFVVGIRRYCAQPFAELDAIDAQVLRASFADVAEGSSESPANLSESAGSTGLGRVEDGGAGREALERFTVSFTDRARAGLIDPIFGRDHEIRQMMDVLARRRKNNPIIVGEPGVGKTALVEGLALAIVHGEVPQELADVDLRSLDLGLLKAGAAVRGELENRLKQVIEAVRVSPTPIIVFIDEAHTLMGGSGNDADLANLLKPALARGEFRTIAATTWREFKKYFEKDPALERRFQPVSVHEPSVTDALVMLRGLRETYESAHGVKIRDDALRAAVELSDRFISGRQLPDKAIDLLDTTAARVKIDQAAPPYGITRLTHERMAIERELAVRRRDLDEGLTVKNQDVEASRTRIVAIDGELHRLQIKHQQERAAIDDVRAAEQALATAAQERRDELISVVKRAREHLAALQGETPLCHHEVDGAAVSRVVSDWTGVPVGKMTSSAIDLMLELEPRLKQRIRGQDHATVAVAEAIRMSHAGVRDPNMPVAVLLFVGPSGVGKTETALALADLLFGGERHLVTVNMSEFQEKHSVSRLIGSPPGYVGFGEGGILTEAVRQRPYSVVLLDECEKADLEVMNLFYQVFDKGTLADGEGRVVDFRNTVVILTSNLASDIVMDMHADACRPTTADVVEAIRAPLSQHFKPALLARMTMVPFRPMESDVLGEIAKLKLAQLAQRLRVAHGVDVVFDDALIAALVDRRGAAETGARALDHTLRGSLLPKLARALLETMVDGAVPPHLRIGSRGQGEWTFKFGSH